MYFIPTLATLNDETCVYKGTIGICTYRSYKQYTKCLQLVCIVL